MITLEIYNSEVLIKGSLDKKIVKELDVLLSYQIQGFQFMNTGNNWDGRFRLLKNKNKFPIGLLSTVIESLSRNNIVYEVYDLREKVYNGEPISLDNDAPFKIRDYQELAINKCIESKSGIVRMCTGSGKSLVIASIAAYYNIPTVIYVVSIDLLYQMVDTLKVAYNIDAGIIGDGVCDIKKINIMTIWSAGAAFNKKLSTENAENVKMSLKNESKSEQIRDLVTEARLLILDECQYAGSDTFQFLNTVSKSARHRFLFSGTPWRENGDDILLEAVAGKKIVDVSASELIKRGFLVRPKIAFKDIPIIKNIGKTYHDIYSSFIVNNHIRNMFAINAAKNFLDKDKNVLFLVKKIEHGNILAEEIDKLNINFVYLDGSKSTKVRQAAIEDAKSGKVNVLIASAIFDQGIDIPNLDVLLNMGGGKSTGRTLQRIGRVIRGNEGKTEAHVLDFYDNAKYVREHSKIRYNISKSEEEFLVRKI